MYKTISINNSTYQNLQAIASRMDKPKAQVVDELIKKYIESMKVNEKKQLLEFNTFVGGLAKQIKLPSRTKVNTTKLDKQFSALKDTNY